MKRVIGWFLVVAFAMSMLFAGPAQHTMRAADETVGESPRIESALPAETLAILSVRDYAGLNARCKASPWNALWQDPSVKAFFEGPLAKVQEEFDKKALMLDLDFKELSALPSGQAGVILHSIVFKEGGGDPSVAVSCFLDFGDRRAQMQQTVDKLVTVAQSEAQTHGKLFATRNIQHQNDTIVEIVTGGTDSQPDENHVYYVIGSRLFILGVNNLEYIKTILTHYGNNSLTPNLTTDPEYAAAMTQLGGNPDITMYLGLGRLVPMLVQALTREMPGFEEQGRKIFESMGIFDVKSLAVGFEIQASGRVDYGVFIGIPAPRRGLMQMLCLPPVVNIPPAWIPKDAMSYGSYGVDADVIWKELNVILDSMDELGTMARQGLEAWEAQMGLTVAEDVIAPLGKQIVFMNRARAPFDMHPDEWVFTIALDQSDKFKETLVKLSPFLQNGMNAESEEFEGGAIYVTKTNDYVPNAAGGFDIVTKDGPTFGVYGNVLVIANTRDIFKEHLPNILSPKIENSLASLPEYQRASAAFAGQVVCGAAFSNFALLWEQAEWYCKKAEANADSDSMNVSFSIAQIMFEALREAGFDMSKRPSFTLLGRCASSCAGIMQVTDAGISGRNVILPPIK